MENHPIPQDVTGFQFKLIGNMTVKQFAYVAVGVILAWVFLQLPTTIFIKLPLSAFCAILGTSLAFLPVGGRPLDQMIGHFIKALIRPTQFIYEKSGVPLYYSNGAASPTQQLSSLPIFREDKLKTYLASSQAASATPLPNPTTISAVPTPPSSTSSPVVQQMQNFSPPASFGIATLENPESPNIIIGVTRDPRGNTLPNILIEIKDKDGNPVRAFKTNEVGRFASATPLTNGAYTIEFEDPKTQNKFENIILNVNGQIITPIIAISIDTREELRRSLFAENTQN